MTIPKFQREGLSRHEKYILTQHSYVPSTVFHDDKSPSDGKVVLFFFYYVDTNFKADGEYLGTITFL